MGFHWVLNNGFVLTTFPFKKALCVVSGLWLFFEQLLLSVKIHDIYSQLNQFQFQFFIHYYHIASLLIFCTQLMQQHCLFHYSLLTELRPVHGANTYSLPRQSQRRGGGVVVLSGRSDLSDIHSEKSPKPEWLERELLRQKHRRHSITFGDNKKFTQLCIRSPCISKFKVKLFMLFSVAILFMLVCAFQPACIVKLVFYSISLKCLAFYYYDPIYGHSTHIQRSRFVCFCFLFFWLPKG